jgi:hypothetical protein
LKESESRETVMKKQLEKAKQLLLNMGNGNSFTPNDANHTKKDSKKPAKLGKSSSVFQESTCHIVTITPRQSQTTITTIFKPIPSLPNAQQKQPAKENAPITTHNGSESKLNVNQDQDSQNQNTCVQGEDSTEALLRDLFFPFST